MAEICIKVPDELKDKISNFSELAFARIIEKAIDSELEKERLFEELEELTKNSDLSDEDCERFNELVKKRFLKKL
jgi:hypothetical protein